MAKPIEHCNMTDLALEIVYYAALDWRRLVKARAWDADSKRGDYHEWQLPNNRCNFTELRQFFRSDWCEFLLRVNHVATTGSRILALLEAELEEAMEEENEQID